MCLQNRKGMAKENVHFSGKFPDLRNRNVIRRKENILLATVMGFYQIELFYYLLFISRKVTNLDLPKIHTITFLAQWPNVGLGLQH